MALGQGPREPGGSAEHDRGPHLLPSLPFSPLGRSLSPPSFSDAPACSSGPWSCRTWGLSCVTWASQDSWESEPVGLRAPRESQAWHPQQCPAEVWEVGRWSTKCTGEGGSGPTCSLPWVGTAPGMPGVSSARTRAAWPAPPGWPVLWWAACLSEHSWNPAAT